MNQERSTRREFHRHLAAAGTAALAGNNAAPGQQEEPKTDADIMAALIEARFGKHLTPEQLAKVKRSLRNDLARAEYLRRMPLKNSDEPSFLFRADL
ncbi:MAG: twin-arginine translocation signal domain-containing protein [Gemmataceae bacterium]